METTTHTILWNPPHTLDWSSRVPLPLTPTHTFLNSSLWIKMAVVMIMKKSEEIFFCLEINYPHHSSKTQHSTYLENVQNPTVNLEISKPGKIVFTEIKIKSMYCI
jgi:hypothetical protein